MMIPVSAKVAARQNARLEAARALIRFQVDQSQPVDIFKIIQDQGIWLMFQPLKNLFGAYIPQEDAVGIILHSKHPLSLQRFTAAHEFAHHVLKHPLSMDDEGVIERAGSSTDLREVAADTFAAFFLMPLQLVNATLLRMGLPRDPKNLTDLQVYQIALDMGVSYSAAVNHLSALHKISRNRANELRKRRPKDIKSQIGGPSLDNSRADIWVLDKDNAGKHLRLRVGDELRISLPENPSTGYVWMLDTDGLNSSKQETAGNPHSPEISSYVLLFEEWQRRDTALLQDLPLALINAEFETYESRSEKKIYGNMGSRYLTIKSLSTGTYTLRLIKQRPWQKASQPADQFQLHLNVSQKPTGDSENGLSDAQKSLNGTT